MEDKRNDDRDDIGAEKHWENGAPDKATRWLVLLIALLVTGAVFGGAYIYEQTAAKADLTAQNQSLQSTVEQMRTEIGALAAKVDQMSTPPSAPAPPAAAQAAKPATSAASSAQTRRVKQIQSQLAEQQKQLMETQDQLNAAKSDLEGQLGSTRDELNGSIARTHDELVTLEKRGERSYFEFDLSKSKGFQREGPIQISLRKADSKHQSYDLLMLVDDHQLAKKKVDLYEPIWLHQEDQPQPVQVVVNKIDKDHIHGYVSAPKYSESELTSSAAAPSSDSISKPVSTPSPTSSSHSTSTTSSIPAISSARQQSPSE